MFTGTFALVLTPDDPINVFALGLSTGSTGHQQFTGEADRTVCIKARQRRSKNWRGCLDL